MLGLDWNKNKLAKGKKYVDKNVCDLYVCLFDFETIEFPGSNLCLVKKRSTKCFKARGECFVL